ncbi:MAG: hypothetical protein HY925_05100 [Elusimicrobia bacterium]|nr:hypothetical protein [Elusimicrobiota bacterium]
MNRIKIQRVLAALTLAGALSSGSFAQQVQDWSKLHGTWSGVVSPKQVVIQDETAWKAVWAEHARGGAAVGEAPKVDFTKEAVVAVFLGNRMTSSPVETVIENKNGEVVVSVKEGGSKPYSMPALCQPFEIVKVAKAPVIRIQVDASKSKPVAAVAAANESTGLRDAVGRVTGKLANVFAGKTDTLAFDGGNVAAVSLVGAGEFGAPKASLLQLPPPPGEERTNRGDQGLPPPPGQQQPSRGRQGGSLPPPPGDQGGSLPPPPGGNQGGSLPPPPQYRGRPSDDRSLPPPPGHNTPIEDSGVTSVGYWHPYRDVLGYTDERFGSWQQETDSASITRGGTETGKGQGGSYSANLSSREFRRRYVLYWRWVGTDCDPNDSDRCARWDRQYKYFYEDTKYSRARGMKVVVNFAQDKTLLPWETESFSVKYDGGRVWIEKLSPAYQYSEYGPIVNQQTGEATITLTPGARILRSPEANKVTAAIVNEGGKLKLVIEDSRTNEYAGETLEVTYEIWRDDPLGWRNPLGRDTKMTERTKNGPQRITTAPGANRHVFDLGISASAEYYIDTWSFRRAGSKISSGDWMNRGKGNRVKM